MTDYKSHLIFESTTRSKAIIKLNVWDHFSWRNFTLQEDQIANLWITIWYSRYWTICVGLSKNKDTSFTCHCNDRVKILTPAHLSPITCSHSACNKCLDHFLACLFWRKSRAIVITRSLSLLFENFNVAHYSKSIKVIIIKLGILTHDDKVQLQDKEHNSESYIFGVMSLFN